jgi:hypothetical protein
LPPTCVIKGEAEPLLLEGAQELPRDRLLGLVRNHLETGRKRVTCADGPAKQIDCLRQSRLEGIVPPPPLPLEVPERQIRTDRGRDDTKGQKPGDDEHA